MANDAVYPVLKDDSVSTSKIVDKAVTNSKLADGAVSRSKLNNDLSDLMSLMSFHVSKFQAAPSVDDLPNYSNTTGWIVNNHLYLYTGEDETQPYTDCGELRGAQGVQGEKGEKGEKGDTGEKGERGYQGLYISDIEQPIVSDKDEGINLIRITRSDGKIYSFQIKNGSRGSQGISINNIEQTETSTVDGGKNTLTITLSNGTSYELHTYNGTGRNKGYYYNSLSELNSAVPIPSTTDWAIVNGRIYICETAGTWKDSGYSWKGNSSSLNSLLTNLNTVSLPSSAAYLHWTGSYFNWQNPTTGGSSGDGSSVALNQLLTTLNSLSMPTDKSMLYYTGSAFTWKSGIDLTDYSWWGAKFSGNDMAITNQPLTGVKGLTLTNGTKSVLIDIDDEGNLRFNGNAYATGGVSALGSGGNSSSGGVILGTFLTALNTANPTPASSGQTEVLCYSSGAYSWKDIASAANAGLQIKKNSETVTNSSGDTMSCTSINFSYPTTLTTVPITRTSDTEIKVDLSAVASSASLGSLLAAINTNSSLPTASGQVLTYNGSSYTWTTPSSGSGSTVDLTGYATQTWVKNQGYLTSHQSLSGYATQSWVTSQGYLTSHQSLSNYLTKSAASSTYATLSHTHSTSDISGFTSAVQAIKVNSASSADTATKLTTARTLWGQSFNGTANVSGAMSSVGNMSFNVSTAQFTPSGGYSEPYSGLTTDFKFGGGVAAKNLYSTGKIRLGSSTSSYGTIEWDSANNAFKITGNLYVTGGITALSAS